MAAFRKYTHQEMVKEEENIPFLHGDLRVHVIAARDLPDTDNFAFNISRGDWTDPFVTVFLDEVELLKTSFMQNCLDPVWDEKYSVPVCHNATTVKIKVMDREHIGHEEVGHIFISTEDIIGGEPMEDWYPLTLASGDQKGEVHIAIHFLPLGTLDNGKVLVDGYFKERDGCRVTMYQDADTPALPCFNGVTQPDGSEYKPTRLWIDLFHAINNAKKLIYITGWSVFTQISLIRGDEAENCDDSNVGELLKRKAAEGVRVLVMTWNEKSNDTGLLEGMMGTHDEATMEYFRGTDVFCFNAQRAKESWLGLGGTFVSTLYTHHQKTVVCDIPLTEEDESDARRLVGFVGGVDITNGRYDNPTFPLFKTLFSKHAGDFYQNCTMGTTAMTGPREPWHDIHARVEGPIALDVLQNFHDRWVKQNPDGCEALLDLEEDPDILTDEPAPCPESEGGPWVVQLLRSITIDSAIFDEERINEARMFRKYGRLIDNSIMSQYVNLIRNAQAFIYIENQYFIGSAYSWLDDQKTLAPHTIPREITQKIIQKMEAGESFHCYVCIPMYPEGDPVSAPSQEILRWQFRTIESMYARIGAAIERLGTGTDPTDHLSFYCMGKRESPEDVPDGLEDPDPSTGAALTRETLRHPVYVHSKLMVVDDDYLVCGSANINQRSMAGERDTEICIGAYQPNHGVTPEGVPSGGVHTFRTALWSAHLGAYHPDIEQPQSQACLDHVRQVTSDFWELYTAESPQHSDTHMLPYPLYVSPSGEVIAKEAPWDKFPDTEAPVVGTKCGLLPAKLTT